MDNLEDRSVHGETGASVPGSNKPADGGFTNNVRQSVAMDVQAQLGKPTVENTIAMIMANVPAEIMGADNKLLARKQKELKKLPIVVGDVVSEMWIEYIRDWEKSKFMMVPTDKIVGSVAPGHNDWTYEHRPNKIIEIAKSLRKTDKELIENTFNFFDRFSSDRVLLKSVNGPAGPLFFIVSGVHRVTACKLIKLPYVPAQVEEHKLRPDLQIFSPEKSMADEWQRKIDRGLIKGNIEAGRSRIDERVYYGLTIEKQVLPWMHLSIPGLVAVNRVYNELYPQSLDILNIPEAALFDEEAFDRFLKQG